jgi:hypothetical protein
MMGVATMDSFAGVAGKLHPQLRRDTGVGQFGGKAVPQRVKCASANLPVASTLNRLQIEPGFANEIAAP